MVRLKAYSQRMLTVKAIVIAMTSAKSVVLRWLCTSQCEKKSPGGT